MGSGPISVGVAYWLVLMALATAAALLAAVARLRLSRAVLTAAGRAVVQLAAVGLVITWVLRAWGPTAGFVLVMVVVAAVTSARRIGRGATVWTTAAILLATAPVLALVVATGVLPTQPVAIVPVAGILIGGAMTAIALAGRRAKDDLTTRRGEYEALLALGFTEPAAVRELCRPGIAQALHPALDQTRTVGLVTLPGAFVGVLLGGGNPIHPAAVQLLVLIGLLTTQVIAIVAVTELIAHDRIHR